MPCRLGEGARKAAKGWGLDLLCKDSRWRSDALTVIETPKVNSRKSPALSLAKSLFLVLRSSLSLLIITLVLSVL